MKLRYTGTGRTTLLLSGREVEPFEEFDVADEAGAAFTGRPDFERLDAPEDPAEPEPGTADTATAQGPGKRKTTKAAAGDPAETQHTDESAPTA